VKTNIAGLWSQHDCSYCVLENGKPIIHAEYERYLREKEPAGDAMSFLISDYQDYSDIKYFATCCGVDNLQLHAESFKQLNETVEKNKGELFEVGHHLAHAANAFFSSNYDESLVITIDGGGLEKNQVSTSCTINYGKKNKIDPLHIYDFKGLNLGKVWTRSTRYIFKMHTGWPLGHKAGTVMAMGALGEAKYLNEFYEILTNREMLARATRYNAGDQKRGIFDPEKDKPHPIYHKWRILAEKDEQEKFNIAASLQLATEIKIKEIIEYSLSYDRAAEVRNLCLSGGVVLNSVAIGKIFDWFPGRFDNIYIPPAPNDAGLTIGAAQYVWHHLLDNSRIEWEDNFTPYLGKKYSTAEVKTVLESFANEIECSEVTDEDVLDLLDQQNVVSVFGGGSESGKRALGNRSILADPRSLSMKDTINFKVKHREWYRPFAPSILREEVSKWFERDFDSPYMSLVGKFKKAVRRLVPAVVHFDGSARLQTVTEKDNFWYYNFIKKWNEKTGVPILLNTSFNDREPICETPEHAVKCFLKTDIDALYFFEESLLITKLEE